MPTLTLYEDNAGGLYWSPDGERYLDMRRPVDGMALTDARLWAEWSGDFPEHWYDGIEAEPVAYYWPGGLTTGGGDRAEGIHLTGHPLGHAATQYIDPEALYG